MFSQKYTGFVFEKYLGELIPRIISKKYNLRFSFLKSFNLLFLGVFCAIEYLDKVLPFSKKQWQLFRRFNYSHNSWYNT
jgi:hypothetical protein